MGAPERTADRGEQTGRAELPFGHRRPRWRQGMLGAVAFTTLLLGLIALSIEAVVGELGLVLIGSVLAVVAVFHLVFPGSQFFTLALSNFIGIYACIFVFFIEANFISIGTVAQSIGFIMPLCAFLGGAWWRADSIRSIVMSRRFRDETQFSHALLWLLPMILIGGLTFVLPGQELSGTELQAAFLSAMTIISVIVIFVSRDIAIFLLDTGLLFEGFFQQTSRLLVPAFAFLTFYSLLVIMFAGTYAVTDRFSTDPNFTIEGVRRHISFSESLYFSVVTLSTVGYGDIHPSSGLVRLIATVQIVLGVLLLLFGFSAILGHSEARHHRERDRDPL